MKASLSVIIPFFNEEDNVRNVLDEVTETLKSAGIPFELICINNGSTDSTKNILSEIESINNAIRIVTVEVNRGYGYGIIRGIKNASMDRITIISGDGQVAPSDILKGYNKMEQTGADFIKPKRTSREDGLYRLVISFVYSLIMKLFFNLKGWDFNAPPKIIKKELLEKMNLESKNNFIDPELLIEAAKLGAKIEEVEVTYRRRSRGTGHTGLKTIVEFIIDIIRWKLK